MKIVVLDGYTENPGDLSWDELGKLGDLTVYDRTSLTDEGEIISRIGDAEVVFTNKTPISKAVIDACPNMKFISLLATGYNVVDYVYAGEKGIPVTNVPTYGTASVSQFSIALLLEICHHIGHHSDTVRAGKWAGSIDWCYWDYPLIELDCKTMGIIGFGRIGQAEGRIAKALGMNVLAYDVYPNDAGRAIAEYVSLDELYARASRIMDDPGQFIDTCRGKVAASLFYEPSTRTNFSFQTAMLRLGGTVFGFADPNSSSVAKGETLKDTIKMVSSYADVVVMRTPWEGAAKAASLYSHVPVVNAGDGGHMHPTQTMADLTTMTRLLGKVDGLSIGLCGR